ncbi:MAG: hypothetical protein HY263_12215 [Chloroflexi bacterium]|nr:hypothetical protein [Chloroflexota bacterium]
MTRLSRRALVAAPLVAVAGAALALSQLGKPVLALDPRAAACGPSISGSIAEQFPLTQASDYRQRFPHMGLSPELDVSTPAFVVVYAGIVHLSGLSVAPAPQGGNGAVPVVAPSVRTDFTGVVCVVVNGEATVYSDVDTSP